MDFKKEFFGTGRGWMHSAFGVSLTYFLIYLGYLGFWSPLKDLSKFIEGGNFANMLSSLIGYIIIVGISAVIIELAQGQFFNVDFSVTDVLFTISGVPLAAMLNMTITTNIYIFVVCLMAFLSALTYAVLFLRKYYYKK